MSGHVDGLFQVTRSLRELLRMGLATTFSGGSGFTVDQKGHYQSLCPHRVLNVTQMTALFWNEHDNFPLLELSGPTMFQHDNAPVHKACGLGSLEGLNLNPTEHLSESCGFNFQLFLAEWTQIPTVTVQS